MTFIVLFVCYMITGIATLIPETSGSSLAIYMLLTAALAMIIYHMIKNLWIAGGIGIAGEAALLIAYFVKPTLFESGIQKFLGIFDITSHFDNFTNGILDLNGVVYFLSVIIVLCSCRFRRSQRDVGIKEGKAHESRCKKEVPAVEKYAEGNGKNR